MEIIKQAVREELALLCESQRVGKRQTALVKQQETQSQTDSEEMPFFDTVPDPSQISFRNSDNRRKKKKAHLVKKMQTQPA